MEGSHSICRIPEWPSRFLQGSSGHVVIHRKGLQSGAWIVLRVTFCAGTKLSELHRMQAWPMASGVVTGAAGSSECGSELFSEIFLKRFLIILLVCEMFLIHFLNLQSV